MDDAMGQDAAEPLRTRIAQLEAELAQAKGRSPAAPPEGWKCVIYGASDDLIEIEGAIREEFGAYGADETYRYMAFSDGTVLKVEYTRAGCWEFRRIVSGTAAYEHQAHDGDRTTYTDRVTLTGDIRWVVVGEGFAKGGA